MASDDESDTNKNARKRVHLTDEQVDEIADSLVPLMHNPNSFKYSELLSKDSKLKKDRVVHGRFPIAEQVQ